MKKRIITAGAAVSLAIALTGCNALSPSIELIPDETGISSEEQTKVPVAPAPFESQILATLPESNTEAITIESTETGEAQPEEPQSAAPTEPIVIEPTPEVPVAPGMTAVSQIVKTTANVHLRVGAGTEYNSAGIVPEGTQLSRVEKGDVWSKVVYDGVVYYMASQYLEVVTDGETLSSEIVPVAPTESSIAPTEPTTQQTIDFSGANLSDLAGISNDSIPFGYGNNDRDEQNRPNGCKYYATKYGSYGANFIAPDDKVYLTMDEGYEAGHTPAILDTLKEKNVKAVFFLTKQFVTEHPELVTRMINEGHVLGNHSCKHPADGMPSLGLEGEYNDIMWLHNYVKENWGYEMKLFRYPSGIFSEQSLALVKSMGYTPVFWSYAHKDWVVDDQPELQSALKSCLDQVHPGAIYLLHAVSKTNTENMAAFIDGVRAKGFEFGVYPQTGF